MAMLSAIPPQASDDAARRIVGDHWCESIGLGAGEAALEIAAKRFAGDFPQADAEAPSFAAGRSDAELPIIGVM